MNPKIGREQVARSLPGGRSVSRSGAGRAGTARVAAALAALAALLSLPASVSGDSGVAAPTVTLSVADDSISENGGSTTVSATLSHASSEATTITISPVANAYAVGSDATITIAAGETANSSDTATINAVDNDIGEADRSVTVTGSASNARGIGQVTGASLTLEDDDGGDGPTGSQDSVPTVSIDSPSVTEGDSGSKNLTFTVTLNKAGTEQVTVDYADAGTGTATSGTDYTAVTGGTLTFAVGTTSQTFNVSVTGDTTDEADETVVVTLSDAANATIGTATGTGTITDNDAPPSLSINSPRVTEGDSGSKNLTFTATLSAASGKQVTVDWAEGTGGTATSGTDYTAITGGTLTFAVGTTSQTFNVSVTGDTTEEPNETVVATLSNAANATISTATGTGTIVNDDGVTVSINSPSVTEGDSGSKNLTFTATLNKASTQQVMVNYADAGTGTATSGTDYTAITGDTLTFAVGITSQTFNVSVTGDTDEEADETVIVTLSGATNATISTATGTGTITDNDPAPSLSINSPSVTEGDSGSTNLTFTVTLNKASAEQVTVDYADARTGTATSGTDYTAITGGTLTFAVGTTSQTFDVSVSGDTLDEADETVVVTLSDAANASIGTATGTGTITDNDAPPSLSINSPSVTEGDSGSKNLTFTATLSAASGKQVTVDWAEGTGGTATSGTDYTAITGGTLTFAAGTTSQTFNVSVTGDTTDEADETVVVTLSNAANATIGTATGTGTITNNDPEPSLSINSPSVTEGDSGSKNLTFTVTLSAASGKQVTVDYSDTGVGTAVPGTDYTAITDGTLTFAPGTTSQTFNVSVTGDTDGERNETLRVTLSNATNATIGTAIGTGTITDDDAPHTLSVDSPSVEERNSGSRMLTFTLKLSRAHAQTIYAYLRDAGTGTATPGTDYTSFAPQWVSIASGETAKTFSVSVTGDTVKEPDETVVLEISTVWPRHLTTLSNSTRFGTGTITDDDTTPGLSISSPRVAEGNSGSATLTYAVTLSAAATEQVTVSYADAGTGTATSGTDYTAITGGTLTFAAGTTSQTFNVSVTGDTIVEPHETIAVRLSNASGATILTATGTGTIANDDGTSSISISSPTMVEGTVAVVERIREPWSTLRFIVTLNRARSQPARVTL